MGGMQMREKTILAFLLWLQAVKSFHQIGRKIIKMNYK